MPKKNDKLLKEMLETSKKGQSFSLEEIGKAMGLSSERVRQIEELALCKIMGNLSESEKVEIKNALFDYRKSRQHSARCFYPI